MVRHAPPAITFVLICTKIMKCIYISIARGFLFLSCHRIPPPCYFPLIHFWDYHLHTHNMYILLISDCFYLDPNISTSSTHQFSCHFLTMISINRHHLPSSLHWGRRLSAINFPVASSFESYLTQSSLICVSRPLSPPSLPTTSFIPQTPSSLSAPLVCRPHITPCKLFHL